MKKNKSNKTIYVNKYDYMHYYTRCEPTWFLSNLEIDNLMQKTEFPLKEKLGIVDDSDEEDELINSLADYEAMEEAKMNGTLDDWKISHESDSKIIEGLIVDKKVKEFISDYYKKQASDIEIIDYDIVNSQLETDAANDNQIQEDINLKRSQKTKDDINK